QESKRFLFSYWDNLPRVRSVATANLPPWVLLLLALLVLYLFHPLDADFHLQAVAQAQLLQRYPSHRFLNFYMLLMATSQTLKATPINMNGSRCVSFIILLSLLFFSSLSSYIFESTGNLFT